VTRTEFEVEMGAARAGLDEILRAASPAVLLGPRTIHDWSCADVLAHLAGYTRSIADELAASSGRARLGPEYQAAAEASVDDYNRAVVAFWREQSVEALLAEEQAAFGALLDEVLALPDGALIDEQRFPFTGGRSLAAILPNNSYAHYRMHLPELRSALEPGRAAPTRRPA
jgi:mycothiol maleylpyruvate isomerase-like protein